MRWPQLSSALAAVCVVFLAGPVLAAQVSRPVSVASPPQLAVATPAGWQAYPEPLMAWKPRLVQPRAEQSMTFRRNSDEVGLFVGLFREQRQGSELVSSVNMLLTDEDRRGVVLSSGVRIIDLNGDRRRVRTAKLRVDGRTFVVWSWYWLDDRVTVSDSLGKLLLAIDRILGVDDTSAWVSVYAIEREGGPPADTVLKTFMADVGVRLDEGLGRVRDSWQ